MATKEFIKNLAKLSPIEIGGEKYDLVFHDKRWRESGSPGTVIFPHAKIYLDVSLENNRILGILTHELIEIINEKFSLTLPHPSICILEGAMTSIFRDNKELGQLITSHSDDYNGNSYEFSDFYTPEEVQVEEISVKELQKSAVKGNITETKKKEKKK